MDPELLKGHAAFKKRAATVPLVENKAAKSVQQKESKSDVPTKRKKKKSKFPRPKPQLLTGQTDTIKHAAYLAHLGNNPARILKAVVDLLKQRYLAKQYTPLGIEDILLAISLKELMTDTRLWLESALKNNAKIHCYPETQMFLYKPSLGHGVRNRLQLLNLLQEHEKEGLGGIRMSDIVESVPNAERAVQKLEKSVFSITRGDRDKEEVLFFNNTNYQLEVDEIFVGQWRAISVEGLSEGDIERYLQNVGLGAMQGESRKRKASTLRAKGRSKKSRQTKILNVHLDSELLKDYSEDGQLKKQ